MGSTDNLSYQEYLKLHVKDKLCIGNSELKLSKSKMVKYVSVLD